MGQRKDSVKDSALDVDAKLNRPASEISTKASNLFAVLENVNEPVRSMSPERPATPPTKQIAFAIFKSEQGKDLNLLFQENKDILNSKKREAKEISTNINKTKEEIDKTKIELEKINETKKNEDSNGEIFLDEEEFELIRTLKSLKNSYRSDYEYLQNLRSDFAYCENMVRLSRQKLLSEFEVWYNDSFGVSISAVTQKPEVQCTHTRSSPKDEGEKFENVQKVLLMASPESVPYYNARISTDRRQLYNRSLLRGRSVLPAINDKLRATMISS